MGEQMDIISLVKPFFRLIFCVLACKEINQLFPTIAKELTILIVVYLPFKRKHKTYGNMTCKKGKRDSSFQFVLYYKSLIGRIINVSGTAARKHFETRHA